MIFDKLFDMYRKKSLPYESVDFLNLEEGKFTLFAERNGICVTYYNREEYNPITDESIENELLKQREAESIFIDYKDKKETISILYDKKIDLIRIIVQKQNESFYVQKSPDDVHRPYDMNRIKAEIFVSKYKSIFKELEGLLNVNSYREKALESKLEN